MLYGVLQFAKEARAAPSGDASQAQAEKDVGAPPLPMLFQNGVQNTDFVVFLTKPL